MAFAPPFLGLQIAAGAADGMVRVYEAIDVTNLAHWPLQDSFEGGREGGREGGVTSLSWNKCRFDPPMMVVGGSGGGVRVWVGREEGQSGGHGGRRWEMLCELSRGGGGGGEGVRDVAWAPKMGRSYHLIATAGRDNKLRIHTLRREEEEEREGERRGGRRRWVHDAVEDTQEIDVGAEIWRVEWNVVGTLLASSGEDGVVRLWRKDQDGRWGLSKVLHRPSGRTRGEGVVLMNK